jgi:hypothetical protein
MKHSAPTVKIIVEHMVIDSNDSSRDIVEWMGGWMGGWMDKCNNLFFF